jgi:hypothetical protein
LSEKDLETLARHFTELASLSRKEYDTKQSHSVEEARERHTTKSSRTEPVRADELLAAPLDCAARFVGM